MQIKKVSLDDQIEKRLIELSIIWENENSCHGYRKNNHDDLKDETFYLAYDNDIIIGYLFGHIEIAKESNSIIKKDTKYFEIEELFALEQYRNQNIGSKLYEYLVNDLSKDVEYVFLSTATKDYKKILHFYIDKLGLDFWSARLFKKIK